MQDCATLCVKHKWTAVCKPTSRNSSGKQFFFKEIVVNSPSQKKRIKVGPGWNLKSDTSKILFTPQKAVIRNQCFRRSKFINAFLLHFGADSPWRGIDRSLLIQTLFFTSVEKKTSRIVKIAPLKAILYSRV